MDKTLLVVVGPTGIGKTALSIELAKHFKTEIISSDSRQFYKEMQIGTAVPSKEELNAAPHHFIQNLSITDSYSVGDFERDAVSKIESLFQENDILILVGGSGLYNDAVINGFDHFPDVDPQIRATLMNQIENGGLEPLQNQLKNLDPKTYGEIDIHNSHRLVRALEVCIGTGKPYSSFLSGTSKKRSFQPIWIGLNGDREEIYRRINHRVDLMVKQGLLEEAQNLIPFKQYNALNTVGYKELFAYFEGEIDLPTAISEIKKNSRRFAKRQLTWLRKNTEINWFDFNTNYNEIISFIESRLTND